MTRPTRSGALGAALGFCVVVLWLLAAGGADAKAGVALRAIGDFDEPVYVTSPPGDPATLAIVENHSRSPRGAALDHPNDHRSSHR